MSASAFVQLGSIALLLAQTFVSPFIVGMESFGRQVAILAPVFMLQAILEPVFQADFNRSSLSDEPSNAFYVAIASLACIFALVAYLCALQSGSDWRLVLGFVLALVYIIHTGLLSHLYARQRLRDIANATWISVALYVPALLGAAIVVGDGELLLAGTIAFAGASIYLFWPIYRRRNADRVVLIYPKVDWGFLSGALLFRMPTLMLSTGSVLYLALIGTTPRLIGEFRIFVSALNAARYFNVVPLASLQSAINRFDGDPRRFLRTHLGVRYLVSFLAFGVGLVAVFPWAFHRLYGVQDVGRFAILTALAYMLLQPISYAAFISLKRKRRLRLLVPFGASLVVLVGFASAQFAGLSPFLGFGYVSLVALGGYFALLFWTTARSASPV